MLNQPVLLYDGDCAFCRRWVERLGRWDVHGSVRCVPAAERGGVPGLPVIEDEALDRAMHLVTVDGAVYAGAEALPVVLRQVPGWRRLGWVFALPGARWIADGVYSSIARRRHRFGCGSERCRIGRE